MNFNLLRIALAGGLVAGSTTLVTVQGGRSLAGLTAPGDRLPAGCTLKQPEANPSVRRGQRVVVTAEQSGLATPTNPWSGSNHRLAAAIRQRVDGAPPQPDGPPLGPRASASYQLKSADDVIEAYRATYRSADEPDVEVFAVRFDAEALARPTPPAGAKNVPRGVTSRVVLGPTVVLVSTRMTSSCFQAIDAYVRSLK